MDRFLGDRLERFSNVNRFTVRQVQRTLQQGLERGETIDKLTGRITHLFRAAESFRAPLIARTETIASSNRGALVSAQTSGIVKTKSWLHSFDEDVRGEPYPHNISETVGIDDKFVGTGESMDHPAGGSIPANNINCRCTVTFGF